MTTRPATEADTWLVAHTVLAALELPAEYSLDVSAAVSDPGTLYSLKNGVILENEGRKAAGCMICYSGTEYGPFLRRTWELAWPGDPLPRHPEPSGPTEWYVDSLCILPRYRGLGYGRLLLDAALGLARRNGFETLGLLADSAHPKLVRYYEAAGFRRTGRVPLFGRDYLRLSKTV